MAEVVVTSRFARLHPAVLGAATCLLGLSVWSAPSTAPAERVLWTVIALLGTVLTARALRSGVTISAGTVIVRGYFRTRSVRTATVRKFEWEDSGGLIPWQQLSIVISDGTRLRVPEVCRLVAGSARSNGELDRLNRELGQ